VVTGACVVDDASEVKPLSEVDDNSSLVAIDAEPPPQADAASARAVTTERTNTTGSLTTFLPCGESGGTLPARRRTLKHADSLSTAWGRTQQRSFAPRFAPSSPSWGWRETPKPQVRAGGRSGVWNTERQILEHASLQSPGLRRNPTRRA